MKIRINKAKLMFIKYQKINSLNLTNKLNVLAINNYNLKCSKALSYIIKQCDYGPRYPGSEGHSLFKDYLVDFVTELSDSVIVSLTLVPCPF